MSILLPSFSSPSHTAVDTVQGVATRMGNGAPVRWANWRLFCTNELYLSFNAGSK